MDELKKKLRLVECQIKWAEEQMESPEYKDDPESLAFFQGILFLGKILKD